MKWYCNNAGKYMAVTAVLAALVCIIKGCQWLIAAATNHHL